MTLTKVVFLSIVFLLTTSYSDTKINSKVQIESKLNALKNSPFLMNQDALPHLTKLIIAKWDKEKLGLSDEQKKKLLVVRKDTISGVKAIKQTLKELEAEIIEIAVDSEELASIKPKVDEVAKLKAKATMLHLKCLKDSIEILTEDQVEFLMEFWGA